jgi:hypothetical protein
MADASPVHARWDGPSAGLCASCRYSRVIATRRGSTFRRCERSTTDPGFPRYPALPVVRCSGFEREDPPVA